ncbi:MAG: formylglycine-generating enzyme family protein [Mariniphaga sp.]|nr:formylglycine-generating enzyme family protein [Mariniphaga sp.]MDD4425176.1 formylglycine-generating enzyme family protein [Mariniphaga sp.]
MGKLYLPVIILIMFSCSREQKKENQARAVKTESAKPIKEDSNRSTLELSQGAAVSEGEMVYFEGGIFMMGSENGLPNEQPVHQVKVGPFYMDKSPVTVAQFRQFTESTSYQTEAEKFGDSGVFNLDNQSWELLPGAYWLKPFGTSGPTASDDHPVTHVSWNDAVAYADWAGKRLPTEAEWEFAARSGKPSKNKFSWGNEVTTNNHYFANTWQGEINTPETSDGYLFTSPVGVFGENEAGLTDMGGNVWQWCADTYKPYPGSDEPFREDPNVRVIRSGSFFYDQNGEDSFSVSGRSMNSVETSLFNTGFRCAKDPE